MESRPTVKRWRRVAGAAALAASAVSASAVTDKVFDFNTDPSGVLNTYGNAEWRSTDGNPASGGYLSITDAVNSQKGIIVFDDFDSGLIVKGFNFKVDLRIGNAVGQDGRPADGFSVNFARETDPMIVKVNAGETPDGYNDTAGTPEMGTTTGISVNFDTWSGNALPDGADIEGVLVRLDNKTLTRVAMPTRNGACEDPTSLQTGPYIADSSGAVDQLCWQQLEVDLNDAGALTVKWKGSTLLDKYQTAFLPSRGRIVLMGRTGDANQNNHADNIRITTIPASTATVSGLTPRYNGFVVSIDDAPGSEVETATVSAKLDGAPVTVTASKAGGKTTVTYALPAGQRLTSNSAHALELTFKASGVSYTVARDFTVPAYGTVYAGTKATGVNTGQPGFRIRPHQVDGGQPNSLAWTEEQLYGLRGVNRVNLAMSGITADAEGFIAWDNQPIDFKNASGGTGYFPVDVSLADLGIPGFAADGNPLANENSSALEILTFVQFPTAGMYTMVVASDDGFRVQTGANARDLFSERLGQFDGGRGVDAGTAFDVYVEEPGIYPMRLMWENGDGGAGVEWHALNADGTRSLIGDASDPKALKAYRTSTATLPYVARVTPSMGATGAHARPDLSVDIANASGLDAATVQLSLDGAALTTTRTTTGGVLTAKASVPTTLASGSTHTARLTYTPTGGTPVTREWSFTVIGYGASVLPASIAGDLGSGSVPGFRVRAVQMDVLPDQTDATIRQANELYWVEGALAGKAGTPNVADLTKFTDGGFYPESGTINYAQPEADGLPAANGNFSGEKIIPGMPGLGDAAGNTDSFSAEVLTYVEFPAPGFYMMGVNSDDGFKVTSTHQPGTQAITVTAPASIAGPVAGVLSRRGDESGGIFGPLPTTPIEAEVVLVQGNNVNWDGGTPAEQGCGTALVNAAAVSGKIALVSRGTCTFLEKVRNAANAGAVGVLVFNNRSDPPILMTGDANTLAVPALMIRPADGAKLRDTAGVRVRLQGETGQVLGQYNTGRGATDTVFGMQVDKAGVYPLRLVWWEGGGGANVEWFSVQPDGSKILLNDTAKAGALRTFQKATIVARPTIAVASEAGGLKITYGGTLQSADKVDGPYTDVAGAPAGGSTTVSPTAPAKFYRARN